MPCLLVLWNVTPVWFILLFQEKGDVQSNSALFYFPLQDLEARRFIDQKVEVVVSQEYFTGKIMSQYSQLFFFFVFYLLLFLCINRVGPQLMSTWQD